jgi:hypothetical protein
MVKATALLFTVHCYFVFFVDDSINAGARHLEMRKLCH